jgi:uncharacterized repeat protein (TIGR01451 family)
MAAANLKAKHDQSREIVELIPRQPTGQEFMTIHPRLRQSVAWLILAFVLGVSSPLGADDPSRERQTRDRQTYDVIAGDTYTGRSPYFRRPPVVAAAAKPKTGTPAPTSPPPTAAPCATPTPGLISLSKVMPREASIGETFTVELRAVATGCAANVVVSEVVPEGMTLAGTEPKAEVTGANVVWSLGNLDAGESRVLKLMLKPEKEGPFTSCATVRADPRVCGQIVVGRPKLSIETSGPETGPMGADLNYTVVVKNVGTAVVKNVVVTDKYPAGLGGIGEKPFSIGDLAPGQSKTIAVSLKATERGKHCNVAVASASNAPSVQDDACTTVVKTAIKIAETGDAEQYLHKEANYKIAVTNTGDTELTAVTVVENAPAKTKILTAADATISGNVATWDAGALKPGESKTFALTLTSASLGKLCDTVSVATAQGLKESTETCTLWRGLPAVLLEVADDLDPVRVGDATLYSIVITNQGEADLINISTVAEFPKEMTPVTSQGGTVDKKTVKFPTMPRLAPKQKLNYTITAKGAEVGDARIKVTLTEDQLAAPVNKEESTRVY